MGWSAHYDSKLGIIRSVYAGPASADDFKDGTIKTIALQKDHNTYLICIDLSKLEPALSTLDIYEMPQFYDEVSAIRRSELAIVLPPSGQIRADVGFWETVCRNRGWNVRTFADHPEATTWLLRDGDDGDFDTPGGCDESRAHDRSLSPKATIRQEK